MNVLIQLSYGADGSMSREYKDCIIFPAAKMLTGMEAICRSHMEASEEGWHKTLQSAACGAGSGHCQLRNPTAIHLQEGAPHER